MKTIYMLLLIVIFGATHVYADEIYLKDKRIIKGKVLKITAENIEYDPEGGIPFAIVKRDKVHKIIYNNNNSKKIFVTKRNKILLQIIISNMITSRPVRKIILDIHLLN
jgi:hypothetical protein